LVLVVNDDFDEALSVALVQEDFNLFEGLVELEQVLESLQLEVLEVVLALLQDPH
jgi:hypothetical protein